MTGVVVMPTELRVNHIYGAEFNFTGNENKLVRRMGLRTMSTTSLMR